MKEYGFGTIGIIYIWYDEYDGELNEADVEHVQKMLEEGYSQGELCTVEEDGDTEHLGWWKCKEYVKTVVLDADGSWLCPHCKNENNTERPESIVQCSSCDVYFQRDERAELLNVLRIVQLALAADRDEQPIEIGGRVYALEEVKYCFVDPIIERYLPECDDCGVLQSGDVSPCLRCENRSEFKLIEGTKNEVQES